MSKATIAAFLFVSELNRLCYRLGCEWITSHLTSPPATFTSVTGQEFVLFEFRLRGTMKQEHNQRKSRRGRAGSEGGGERGRLGHLLLNTHLYILNATFSIRFFFSFCECVIKFAPRNGTEPKTCKKSFKFLWRMCRISESSQKTSELEQK